MARAQDALERPAYKNPSPSASLRRHIRQIVMGVA
jgi:hypothetical protein